MIPHQTVAREPDNISHAFISHRPFSLSALLRRVARRFFEALIAAGRPCHTIWSGERWRRDLLTGDPLLEDYRTRGVSAACVAWSATAGTTSRHHRSEAPGNAPS
jgi:hypothetical protein